MIGNEVGAICRQPPYYGNRIGDALERAHPRVVSLVKGKPTLRSKLENSNGETELRI